MELGTAVSTGNKIFRNSNSLEIPQPIEVEAKSNLSLMLKEEEQGEEVLALPSPGTLNDMMSKVQSKLNFKAFKFFLISINCVFTKLQSVSNVLLNYHFGCWYRRLNCTIFYFIFCL